MNDFLNVAKSLEIKEISKDVNCDVDDSSQDQLYDENIEPNNGNTQEEDTIVTPSNDESVVEHNGSQVVSHMNEAGQYPCDRCDKQFSYRKSLYQHIRSAHEGIKYPCNNCIYEATTRESLNRHFQTVHEGVKYPCNLCNSRFAEKAKLYFHRKNKH